jgi:hypothetical protein
MQNGQAQTEMDMDLEARSEDARDELINFLKNDLMYNKLTVSIMRGERNKAYLVCSLLAVVILVAVLAFSTTVYHIEHAHSVQTSMLSNNILNNNNQR